MHQEKGVPCTQTFFTMESKLFMMISQFTHQIPRECSSSQYCVCAFGELEEKMKMNFLPNGVLEAFLFEKTLSRDEGGQIKIKYSSTKKCYLRVTVNATTVSTA